MGHQAEPGETAVDQMTDDGADDAAPTPEAAGDGTEAPSSADRLQRARERVEAFRTLGVDVPALATRLARAEAAEAAGATEVARDLCDEIGVLTGLVRREVVRAVGARLPGGAVTRDEPTAPAGPTPDLRAEIDRRIGDALATARERWAQAAAAEAVAAVAAEVDEKIAAAKAELLAAAPAARPARGAGSDAEEKARFAALRALLDERLAQAGAGVSLNELRKEIAKAVESLREEWKASPAPPAGSPTAPGATLAISDASVAALAAAPAFKELLEDRFNLMLRYLKDEVIPREFRRATGELPAPARESAAPAPESTPPAASAPPEPEAEDAAEPDKRPPKPRPRKKSE